MTRVLAFGALILAVLAFMALVNGLFPVDAGTALPVKSIAPEVCQNDGLVAKAEQNGGVTQVTCSDGLIKLFSNEKGS